VPDDPFADLGIDRTVIMPMPGGRVAPGRPAPADQRPTAAEQAEVSEATAVSSGLNPLLAAANRLLDVLPQLRSSVQHPNPTGLRDSLAQGVRQFEAQARAAGVPTEKIVAARYALCTLIDETATSTSLVRLRGRCPRGERLVGSVPHGHWKTITLVVGLRHDGMVAPFVIDGPMNGTIFLAYVEQCLAPTLDRRDVVIMDNLPAHKVAGVTDAIEAVGATAFYLPPYSPDLNPIEQVFSKLKALLRKAAERTVPKLWRRIRALLRTISDDECLNFFRHAGYASI